MAQLSLTSISNPQRRAVAMEDFWILVCASWRCRDGELKDLRKELNEMLLDEEWRRVMRTRHALTAECLTSPSVSAWMCYVY